MSSSGYYKQYWATRKEARSKIAGKYRDTHKSKIRQAERKRYFNIRKAIFDILGHSCAKCGFDADERALQVDHVNNDGHKEKKGFTILRLFNRVAEDPSRYQTLCANCNQIKEIKRKEQKFYEHNLECHNK